MSVSFNYNPNNQTNYAAGASSRPVTYSNYQTGGVAYGGAPVQNSGLQYRSDSVGSSIQPVAYRTSNNSGYQAQQVQAQPVTNQVAYTNYPVSNVQRSTTHPVEVQHVQHVQVQQPQPVRVSADPQFQTRVSGPAHRVEVDHEEKKEGGISPSAACWGLLGLLGLIGLILGILFGVGVIGRQDTVIEKIGTNNGTAINTNTNVNVNTNTNTNSKTNTNVNVNTNTNTNGGTSSSSSSSTTTNGGATGTNTNTNTNTNGGTSSTTTTTNGSTTTNNNGSATTSTTTTTTANGSTTTTTTGKHQLRPVHSAAKH